MKKDMLRLVAQAEAQGCLVSKGRGGHWKVKCPSGALVIMAWSPSDHRALRNARSRLRRAGVPL